MKIEKYICDNCGAECTEKELSRYHHVIPLSFTTRDIHPIFDIDLCPECAKVVAQALDTARNNIENFIHGGKNNVDCR